MNSPLTFIKRYWPSALTLAVVLYATLCSDPLGADELPAIPNIDKLIHAVMMGGLFGAIVFDTQRAHPDRRLSRRFLMITAAAIMIFGAADEVAQTMMGAGRSGDFLDLAADWTGVAVGYFTAPYAVRRVLKLKD